MSQDDHEESDRKALADARAGVAASGAGMLASLAIGPAGALAGPGLLVARRLVQRAAGRREASAARVLLRAAEVVGGLEILEERTQQSDERLELVARVLEAAGRTTLDDKIRALARVLADGLGDEAGAIDDAYALAAALDDLEAAHVAVLDFLDKNPKPPSELRHENLSPENVHGWESWQLRRAWPGLDVLDAVTMVLSSHGLIMALGGVTYPGNVGPAVWRISALGRRCLVLLGRGVEEER